MGRNILILLGLVLLLLAACSPTPQATPLVVTQLVEQAPTQEIIVTATRPRPPTLAPSPTPLPTLDLADLPTPMPIAQLSPEELFERMDFFTPADGCELPCFNGVTPGISTLADVQPFYARMGIDVPLADIAAAPALGSNCSFFHKVEAYPYSPALLDHPMAEMVSFAPPLFLACDGKTITRMEVNDLYHPAMVDLERLIDNYGLPDDILLSNDKHREYPTLYWHYADRRTYVWLLGLIQAVTDASGQTSYCRAQDYLVQGATLDVYAPEIADWVAGLYAAYSVSLTQPGNLSADQVIRDIQELPICGESIEG